MEIAGEVVTGRGCKQKPPTANVLMDRAAPLGVYLGEAWLGSEKLGRVCAWVQDHQPHIAEVYVAGFEGDLYGSFLTVKKMRELGRKEITELYDKALALMI